MITVIINTVNGMTTKLLVCYENIKDVPPKIKINSYIPNCKFYKTIYDNTVFNKYRPNKELIDSDH